MAHVSTEPSTMTCQDKMYTLTEVDCTVRVCDICLIVIRIISVLQFKSLFLKLLILVSDLIVSMWLYELLKHLSSHFLLLNHYCMYVPLLPIAEISENRCYPAIYSFSRNIKADKARIRGALERFEKSLKITYLATAKSFLCYTATWQFS